MPLKYILDEVSAAQGLTNLVSNASQKARILSKINKAAEEIWEQTDLPGCLREVYLKVMPNSKLALPYFIGEVRAVREVNLRRPWTLNDLRPRYFYHQWPTMWRNWRYIGVCAIQVDITNTAPLTYEIPVANASIIITTTGSTLTANRISESITMDAVSKVGTQSFISIDSIERVGDSISNITIKDSADIELAIVPNDINESRYVIFDVSQYPAGGECCDGTRVMEVLYKMLLNQLVNDSDIFPVHGFDNIIIDKTNQLFLEGQEGKEQAAILSDAKTSRRIEQKNNHVTGPLEKRMQFKPNASHRVFTSLRRDAY